MLDHLQIDDARERWAVGAADAVLAAVLVPARLRRWRRQPAVARILVLRLERVGDLLMSRPALAALRKLAPEARIDLVVGSWNAPIARLVTGVNRIEVVDASWLARGARAPGWPALARRARRWKRECYDLALNFEGDIRSHALMWLSGAPRRIGFDMAGGGPLLTTRVAYDRSRHVADNLLRLVERAFGLGAGHLPLVHERLAVPRDARDRAAELLSEGGGARVPGGAELLVGVHVGGGRDIKQWDPARFGELVARLARTYRARFVFTGSDEDREVVRRARAEVPDGVTVIDTTGRADLLTLAGLLEHCSVFITGDTGPMHLADALDVPVVAIFGPSDPHRWGPLAWYVRAHRGEPGIGDAVDRSLAPSVVVHGDTPCRPCNRIRKPPAHCVGHVPECLQAVTVDEVAAAVESVLQRREGLHAGR